MLKKYFFTISFIRWMVFVAFSSLYSFNEVDTSSIKIPHLDKAVHFTFYFVACVLGVLFLRERTNGIMPIKKALFLILSVTIVFGILMEVLQYSFTVDRMGDVFDGIANTLGSISGAVLTKLYFSSGRRFNWKF